MTGRSLFSRFAQLAFVSICVGALQLSIWLNADKLARPFVHAYVPLTKEAASKRAINSCEGRFQPYLKNCSTPSQEEISGEIRMHEASYEYEELRPAKERVRDAASVVLGIFYAALALAALWALKSWFFMNIWPLLAGYTARLRTSLDLSERGSTRRLRRAEDDFRTLKSLRDDGLITEDVFIARRDKLKGAIKAGPTIK